MSFLELKRLSFRAFSILETSLDAGIELDGVKEKDKDKEGKNSTSRIMVYQRRRRFRIAFRWGREETLACEIKIFTGNHVISTVQNATPAHRTNY